MLVVRETVLLLPGGSRPAWLLRLLCSSPLLLPPSLLLKGCECLGCGGSPSLLLRPCVAAAL